MSLYNFKNGAKFCGATCQEMSRKDIYTSTVRPLYTLSATNFHKTMVSKFLYLGEYRSMKKIHKIFFFLSMINNIIPVSIALPNLNYSSNKIRKAQHEHLNIICQNLNRL